MDDAAHPNRDERRRLVPSHASRTATVTVIGALEVAAAILYAYGVTWMFTSDGVEPPNVVVILGAAGVIAMWIAGARIQGSKTAGWWLAVAALGAPLAILSMPTAGTQPCGADHPPLSQTFHCTTPPPLGLFVASVLITGIALVGAVRAAEQWFARAEN